MEQQITIKTKDNHLIYGTLNWRGKKPKHLIVFVHGLMGNQNEHKYYNAAKFFPKKGFATLRFDFYSGDQRSRTLQNSSLTTHKSDLQQVIDYSTKHFNSIFLVGHSLGALVILLSDIHSCSGVVLWDPAVVNQKRSYLKYNKHLDAYLASWAIQFVVSKKMYQERNRFYDIPMMLKRLQKPLKIVCSNDQDRFSSWKKVARSVVVSTEVVRIPGADHDFNPEGTEEALFKETLKFVKKHTGWSI